MYACLFCKSLSSPQSKQSHNEVLKINVENIKLLDAYVGLAVNSVFYGRSIAYFYYLVSVLMSNQP